MSQCKFWSKTTHVCTPDWDTSRDNNKEDLLRGLPHYVAFIRVRIMKPKPPLIEEDGSNESRETIEQVAEEFRIMKECYTTE